MSRERDYVLGTEDAEIDRLGVQHRVWRPWVLDAFARAGIARGSTVIDVGAGPGFVTVDLAECVGPSGSVLAVERSARFIRCLRDRVHTDRYANVRISQADLAVDPIDAVGCDAAWCRWVACFVASPRQLIRGVAAALKRGGVAVFHEYADYGTWRLLPGVPALDAFVAEVMASWRANGGEPDIARRLPSLLWEEGFRVTSARPLMFAVQPSDEIWRWPAGFVRSGSQRLYELGRVSREWVDGLLHDFDEAERQPHTLMITPLVLELIGERR